MSLDRHRVDALAKRHPQRSRELRRPGEEVADGALPVERDAQRRLSHDNAPPPGRGVALDGREDLQDVCGIGGTLALAEAVELRQRCGVRCR